MEWPDDGATAGRPRIGIITSGIPYTYVKEVAPYAAVLKLGLVHPLPRRLVEQFAASVDVLYVVEELDPVIEIQLKSWGIECLGKAVFPAIGELSPTAVSYTHLDVYKRQPGSVRRRRGTGCVPA